MCHARLSIQLVPLLSLINEILFIYLFIREREYVKSIFKICSPNLKRAKAQKDEYEFIGLLLFFQAGFVGRDIAVT